MQASRMQQKSREALIDLLFLSLYLDDHLSLAEDEMLTEALESLGWESIVPREMHVYRAFSAARAAMGSVEATEAFIADRCAAIRGVDDAGEALTWLSRILASDGLTSSEAYFLKQLENRLFPEASQA